MGPEPETQSNYADYLDDISSALHPGGGPVPEGTVVVVSAGNAGIDLTKVLTDFFRNHPDMAGPLVIAGSSGKPGDCRDDDTLNHKTGDFTFNLWKAESGTLLIRPISGGGICMEVKGARMVSRITSATGAFDFELTARLP
jgi:hypothetical protein